MLGIDASAAAMRKASHRAAGPARRGGLSNALFVASSLEALPAELAGLASLVTVHFPWGSLLRAALGQDPAGTEMLVRLVASGGRLRLLVSAAERDAGSEIAEIDPRNVTRAYERHGLIAASCRPATGADVVEAHSSWGKRLLSSGSDRTAFLFELKAQ